MFDYAILSLFFWLFLPLALVMTAVWWIFVSRKQSRAIDIVFPSKFGWFLLLVLFGFHSTLYGTFSSILFPTTAFAVFGLFVSIGWVVLYWRRLTPLLGLVIGISALSAVLLLWRTSGFIQSTNVCFFFLANGLLFLRLIRGGGFQSVLRIVQESAFVGLNLLSQTVALLGWLKSEQANFIQKRILGWIKTVVIAVVGAVVFIVLLSQADPVFAQLIQEFQEELVGRFFWSIVLLLLFSVVFSMRRQREDTHYSLRWFSNRDAAVLLLVVGAIIGVFLAVQWRYLFGSSRELLEQLNISYSTYVRKGFSELLLATFTGGVVAYLVAVKARLAQIAPKLRWVLVVGNSVLLLELVALLFSAYQRNVLYVETYGLTRVRIIGEVFLAWLAIFLVVLLLFTIVKRLRERLAILTIGIVSLIAWLGIQVVNVDAYIVRGAPGHHDYTDYFYLMQLSEDAAQEQLSLLPAIIAETDQLLAKSSLNETERAQLAGIKLALHSFLENWNDLFLHYASEEAVLAMLAKLSTDDWKDFNWSYPYSYFECQNDSSIRYGWFNPQECPREKWGLSERLRQERSWRFAQPARKHAFALWNERPELIDQVRAMLSNIQSYQTASRLSLYTQESRLLHEFSYPLLSVRLREYYPGKDDFNPSGPKAYPSEMLLTPTPTEIQLDAEPLAPQVLEKPILLPTQEPQMLKIDLADPE